MFSCWCFFFLFFLFVCWVIFSYYFFFLLFVVVVVCVCVFLGYVVVPFCFVLFCVLFCLYVVSPLTKESYYFPYFMFTKHMVYCYMQITHKHMVYFIKRKEFAIYIYNHSSLLTILSIYFSICIITPIYNWVPLCSLLDLKQNNTEVVTRYLCLCLIPISHSV